MYMYVAVLARQTGVSVVEVPAALSKQTAIIARYVSAGCRVDSNDRWQRLDLNRTTHLLTLAQRRTASCSATVANVANPVAGDANPLRLLHTAAGNVSRLSDTTTNRLYNSQLHPTCCLYLIWLYG